MDMKQRARELLRRLEAAIAANQLVLPSLPEVVIRVRALTESGNCSVEELEREISRDPAIAARLVKVANSSIMRRGVPVSSVRQAIVLLGFRLVRSMVTQLALLQTMGRAGGDPGRLRGFVEGGCISVPCAAIWPSPSPIWMRSWPPSAGCCMTSANCHCASFCVSSPS
ncbi:HDOD domain-containing protein [Halopseudomonas formosensis]|uniref:HDOD domain-containing protein n=1 Tax=Halopseudomonas formosensis TaxID=1002526 RepID=A0A1I6B6M5_9GAMM|nr:HDOD domain-containing protein [Halopseudomonas formosensis]SFQ76592.1 HDOD domain-containing protein [Halopseudomonas formosensis]